MNQTQKRLNIIKLAISIGDSETIQLQILKLTPLQNDMKIQEIIRELQTENHARAQTLITEYIETPPEEIHQRTLGEHVSLSKEETEEIIEEFDLFAINPQEEETEEILDIDSFADTPAVYTEKSTADYDALLNLKGDDILPDNIDIEQTTIDKEDDFFHTPENTIKDEVPSSSFFDPEDHTAVPQSYDPIPYIDQKLKNMITQYPPAEMPEESLSSVDAWLLHISNEPYTETEIEEKIASVNTLTQEGHVAEAAQLLLVCAATQSKFAQLILARTLFNGDILEQNLPEAFTLINRLAMDDDYPEAICDLGQLYENGIGITKDKKRAEELYKEAMDLGIKRAKAHYERVHRQNKGLFSFLRK